MNPVALLRQLTSGELTYEVIVLWCPGCEVDRDGEKAGGLHMLPVSADGAAPDGSRRTTWGFDGRLDAPTLSPSILTRFTMAGQPFVCHSFLRGGVWEFLSDCTHMLAGQRVPAVPLPDWVVGEA